MASIAAVTVHTVEGDEAANSSEDDAGSTAAAAPENAAEVESIVNSRTAPGKTEPHRQMGTDEEIRDLYQELTKNGEAMDVGKYPGEGMRLPDGTEIRMREGSKSGGVTLDMWAPIATFDGMVARITPDHYSRENVLAVLRELATKGYIRFGAFPGEVGRGNPGMHP